MECVIRWFDKMDPVRPLVPSGETNGFEAYWISMRKTAQVNSDGETNCN
jgi:hypothetical protein